MAAENNPNNSFVGPVPGDPVPSAWICPRCNTTQYSTSKSAPTNSSCPGDPTRGVPGTSMDKQNVPCIFEQMYTSSVGWPPNYSISSPTSVTIDSSGKGSLQIAIKVPPATS